MAAAVVVAWVASARWSGTRWIVRPRRVRRAQLGCSPRVVQLQQVLAWFGLSFGCSPRSRPLALATFIPSLVRSRIRSDSNSATIASTLNNNRPTGSVGSWIEPPRLSFTLHLVSSSKMSRASGSDLAAGPAWSRPGCHLLDTLRELTEARVGLGLCRLGHGRRRCGRHRRRARGVRRAGR
jgi:hypothetical protein